MSEAKQDQATKGQEQEAEVKGQPEGTGAEDAAKSAAGADSKTADGAAAENAAPADAPKVDDADALAIPPWAQKRIDTLTRQKLESDERGRLLEAQLKELGFDPKGKTPAGRAPAARNGKIELSPQELENLQRAALAEAQFNVKCDETAKRGRTAFSDFDAVMKNYTNLGGLQRPLVEAVLEFDKPEALLYALGKDLNKASEIMTASPTKMAAALAKLDREIEQKVASGLPVVTKAPPPINGIEPGGNGTLDPLDPKAPMADFVRAREQQEKERREVRRRH